MPYTEKMKDTQIKIVKEKLNGYRRPSVQERECIAPYLAKKIMRTARLQRFLSFIFGCVASAMLYVSSEMLEGKQLNKEAIGYVILFISFLTAGVAVARCRIRNCSLLETIAKGDFEVLDCVGKVFSANIDSVAKGIVYVSTKEGTFCADGFIIDKVTALQYENQSGIPLLLMRQSEYDYYEMLTENKLNKSWKEVMTWKD